MAEVFCECGCGELVKKGNRFIKQHHSRVVSKLTREKLRRATGIEERKINYEENPLRCKNCGITIPYEKVIANARSLKFCSQSCSAIFNNRGRRHSEETKVKIKTTVLQKRPPRICKDASKAKLPSLQGRALYDTYAPKIDKYEIVRRSPEDERILQVQCYQCKEWVTPTTTHVWDRFDAIVGRTQGENHFYCPGTMCRSKCSVFRAPPISPREWDGDELEREVQPELRRMRLEIDRYRCQREGCTFYDATETGKGMHCHHLFPVVIEPLESADIDNCRTYCIPCHHIAHRQEGCTSNDLNEMSSC
jgi:hypothetical protein